MKLSESPEDRSPSRQLIEHALHVIGIEEDVTVYWEVDVEHDDTIIGRIASPLGFHQYRHHRPSGEPSWQLDLDTYVPWSDATVTFGTSSRHTGQQFESMLDMSVEGWLVSTRTGRPEFQSLAEFLAAALRYKHALGD